MNASVDQGLKARWVVKGPGLSLPPGNPWAIPQPADIRTHDYTTKRQVINLCTSVEISMSSMKSIDHKHAYYYLLEVNQPAYCVN
jgi:hypothetical protein